MGERMLFISLSSMPFMAWYTVDEVKQILGIGRTTTYDLMHNPPFRVLKLRGRILIPKASFDAWLNGEI